MRLPSDIKAFKGQDLGLCGTIYYSKSLDTDPRIQNSPLSKFYFRISQSYFAGIMVLLADHNGNLVPYDEVGPQYQQVLTSIYPEAKRSHDSYMLYFEPDNDDVELALWAISQYGREVYNTLGYVPDIKVREMWDFMTKPGVTVESIVSMFEKQFQLELSRNQQCMLNKQRYESLSYEDPDA